MNVYSYIPATGEFLVVGMAQTDPLNQGSYLIPAHSTVSPPPDADSGRVVCWDGAQWVQVEDHKGKRGYLNGKPHTITEYGPLPEGWSDTPPPRPAAEVRANLLAEIGARKNTMRDGGFLVDGVLWDSDAGARLAYAELAQRLAADPSFTTRWKASEGQWVTMTAALFAAVYTAEADHIASAFAWQEAEEARLAATPDEELSEFVLSPAEES